MDVILLAGDRGPNDPLATAAGVDGKALVPVAGMAMLTRVLGVLARWPRLGRLILVAPATESYRYAVAEAALTGPLEWVEPGPSLHASLLRVLERELDWPALMLTADHALLDPAWLERLYVELGRGGGADLSLGLSDWAAVQARFPGSRRTRYRFRDRSLCGTNLFIWHRADGVRRILDVWRSLERERKKPWRIVSLLGWGHLARYLAGRLDHLEAFELLSARLGAVVRPMLLDDPLTAVDVDSLADLRLVEQVLAERETQGC